MVWPPAGTLARGHDPAQPHSTTCGQPGLQELPSESSSVLLPSRWAGGGEGLRNAEEFVFLLCWFTEC